MWEIVAGVIGSIIIGLYIGWRILVWWWGKQKNG